MTKIKYVTHTTHRPTGIVLDRDEFGGKIYNMDGTPIILRTEFEAAIEEGYAEVSRSGGIIGRLHEVKTDAVIAKVTRLTEQRRKHAETKAAQFAALERRNMGPEMFPPTIADTLRGNAWKHRNVERN